MVPFPKHPAGFYLISPSEFERFSLSARNVTEPLCCLEVSRLQDTSCLRWAVRGAHRNAGGLLCPPPVPPAPTSPRVSFQQLDGDAEAAASQRHPRPAQPRGQPFPLRQ